MIVAYCDEISNVAVTVYGSDISFCNKKAYFWDGNHDYIVPAERSKAKL